MPLDLWILYLYHCIIVHGESDVTASTVDSSNENNNNYLPLESVTGIAS